MQRENSETLTEGLVALPARVRTSPQAPWASPAMRMIESAVRDIAPTDIPVLLAGEPSTGKKTVAKLVHQLSAQRNGIFWNLKCSTLTPDDLERTLGASGHNGNSGDASTVLLEEVRELQSACQARLLRAISSPSDGFHSAFRLISTTRHNLEEEMLAGRFLDELYYRISGVTLKLPPLRHRKEDITALSEFFLNEYANLLGQPTPSLSDRARQMLLAYSWPGNICELESVIKRLVVLGDEELVLGTLGTARERAAISSSTTPAHSLKDAARAASRQAEREMILRVLAHTRWNRKRAAEQLKISYKALLYKLKQIGLDDSVGI